jgi:FdhD protein
MGYRTSQIHMGYASPMRGVRKTQILSFDGSTKRTRFDAVVQEEPLEIRLEQNGLSQTVNTTMRTSGHDFELAVGWCYAEGLISSLKDIQKVSYCVSNKLEQQFNLVNLKLRKGIQPNIPERLNLSTSACGVCGKAQLQALETHCQVIQNKLFVTPDLLYSLPDKLRTAQKIFDVTGGIHAAALFSDQGELLLLREDVGRHNAVDKVIGWALMQNQALENTILLVSSRAGFEITQKTIRARIPVLVSVSAPTSLAVEVAKQFNQTLIGFLRQKRMNVYAGSERIA